MKLLSRKYNTLDVIGGGDGQQCTPPAATDTYAASDGSNVFFSDVNIHRDGYCRRDYARYAKFIIRQDVNAIISNMVITGGDNALNESLTKNAKRIFEELSRVGFLYYRLTPTPLGLVFSIVPINEKKDSDFKLIDPTLSERFSTPREECAKEIIDFINDLENVQNSLINQAEASDIFTPKETPIVSENKINNFSKKLRALFGLRSNQAKTAFIETPLEHHAIGRYDYRIEDKIKFQFQKLCKLYMYPEDLYFADTTFDNKSDARLQLCLNYAGYFYDVIAQILRVCITAKKISDFSVDFYNVTEWEEARGKKIENVKNTIRFFLELKNAGFEVGDKIETLIKEL